MTGAGPMFLAAVLAETFEDFEDDGIANEAGRLLHDALTRHGYRLTPVASESTTAQSASNAPNGAEYERGWQDAITAMNPPGTVERATLNAAATGLVRRFADAMQYLAADQDRVARTTAALDVEPDEARRTEDSAWASVYSHGKWRYLTSQMTTEERAAAADAVERDWARAEADDPGVTHGVDSRAALRWWEA